MSDVEAGAKIEVGLVTDETLGTMVALELHRTVKTTVGDNEEALRPETLSVRMSPEAARRVGKMMHAAAEAAESGEVPLDMAHVQRSV